MAQWLRICLPMQGTRVRSLVREDLTCHGGTKPVCHNYWACTLEPVCHNYWSPHALEPMCHNYWAHALQLLKPMHSRARMPQLLSPCAATTEAHVPRAHAPQREATTMRSPRTTMKSSPRLLQLEKAHVQQWRPMQPK